jgi:hypothetical protein
MRTTKVHDRVVLHVAEKVPYVWRAQTRACGQESQYRILDMSQIPHVWGAWQSWEDLGSAFRAEHGPTCIAVYLRGQ